MHAHTLTCTSGLCWLVAVRAAQGQPCIGVGVLLGVVAALDAAQSSLPVAAVGVRGKGRQRVGFLGQLLGATLELRVGLLEQALKDLPLGLSFASSACRICRWIISSISSLVDSTSGRWRGDAHQWRHRLGTRT